MSTPGDLLIWVAIIAVALGTWAFRISFVILFGYLEEIPPQVNRTLRFIPPAVIAAIVGPSVLLADGASAGAVVDERLLAALVATVVAWYTEEMLLTVTAGMLVLWAFAFLF